MRRIDPRRITNRARFQALLLLAGAALVAVLAWQLWRTWSLEHGLRTAEGERAALAAERLLETGVRSRAAFDAVTGAQRAVVRDGAVECADVGWLDRRYEVADRDLVVEERIHRATLAEFAQHDAAGATRAFDELLAVPLVPVTRAQTLGAAAWHARRAGDAERVGRIVRELDERVGAFAPADLARPAVAYAVASALRLADVAPAWAARLAPYLPGEVFAGLPGAVTWAEPHRRIAARRDLLRAIGAAWNAQRGRGMSGLVSAGDDRLLWWLPRDDGAHDVALLTAREFVAAVRAAGGTGVLAAWPWFVEPHFADSTDGETAGSAFAGVPGLRGVVPATASSPQQRWLLPIVTVLVLAAFGFAVSQQLRAARGEVRAVRTQAEFLTTVTHELKTPLAAIRLLAEMLAEGRAQGRENDYYRMLAGEAARLSLLIENVLDLGRLERGERAYDLRPVDVTDVIGEVIALFAPVAERDGLRVAWNDRLGSAAAKLDRGALVQALVAVLDNARKYGAAGGVIDVTTRRDGASYCVDVRDRGPGVPAAERERVFERFVRGSAHAHGSTPGVGIGLYLARSIARRLHGDLVCAEPLDGGPGACFTFNMPLAHPAQPEQP